jgi:hypothetical protein
LRTLDPEVLVRLDVDGPACAIGAPVWHELTFGCRRLPRGPKQAALEDYLKNVVQRSFLILPNDEVAAGGMATNARGLRRSASPCPVEICLKTKATGSTHRLPT